MADARTLCMSPPEKLSQFNKRLREACDELAVTNFDLGVVDGLPVVTLLSEEVPATEEDVRKDAADRAEAAQEEGYKPDPEDKPLEVGDWIPTVDPMIVQVTKLSCADATQAEKAEDRCDMIYDRARGGISKHLMITGISHRWEGDPNGPKDATTQAPSRFVHVPFASSYIAIGYLNDEDEDGDDEGESGGGDPVEKGLRSRRKVGAEK